MSLAEIQNKLSPLLREYGIKKAAVFGSVSRGDDCPDSDVDIMISLGEKPMGVFTFTHLAYLAEEKLGRKVDLVTENSVNKFIRPYIMKDLKVIYEG